jgi:hypothetical protein
MQDIGRPRKAGGIRYGDEVPELLDFHGFIIRTNTASKRAAPAEHSADCALKQSPVKQGPAGIVGNPYSDLGFLPEI